MVHETVLSHTESITLRALTWVCHHSCLQWDIWVCASAVVGLCTCQGAGEITVIHGNPHGARVLSAQHHCKGGAKEENCLCAFPPKTDEANLALNAGGEERKLAFLMGFKK